MRAVIVFSDDGISMSFLVTDQIILRFEFGIANLAMKRCSFIMSLHMKIQRVFRFHIFEANATQVTFRRYMDVGFVLKCLRLRLKLFCAFAAWKRSVV